MVIVPNSSLHLQLSMISGISAKVIYGIKKQNILPKGPCEVLLT